MAAAIVAIGGLVDSIYLTVHHYTAESVPCGAMFDCEMVLTSPYATLGGMLSATFGYTLDPSSAIAGLPLGIFGAVAYFFAFSLALLTAFGDTRMWKFFGIIVVLMALFSLFLIYVQAFLIHAFCQFCLISAGTTFTLLILFIASMVWNRRRSQ